MCDPVSVLAIGANVIAQGGSALLQHEAQRQASEDNKREAEKAYSRISSAMGIRQMEEMAASGQSIEAITRQAQQAHALASVSAGESGVAGVSVEALLDIMEKDKNTAILNTKSNLEGALRGLQGDKEAAEAQMRSRIAGVPEPDWALTALRLGKVAADAGTMIIGNQP